MEGKLLILIFAAVATSASVVPETKEETYDFIVVGAGVGGSVVAGRLSESGKYSVLLLEEGTFPLDPNIDIPALKYEVSQDVSKRFKSVPQKKVAQKSEGVVTFTAGRMMGGGSGMNGMQYNRGSPDDYNNWANLTGDQSWSYANMLEYFRKAEDYNGNFPMNDLNHGKGGPISVSRPTYAPGLDVWEKAGVEMGYPGADPNGPQKRGLTALEFSMRKGHRVSAYEGYLKPYMSIRKNLKVVTDVTVKRILFSKEASSIRATGVTFVSVDKTKANDNLVRTVRAKNEVIVSGGVMGSPTILLRSGIGPKAELEKVGVPLVKDLPVGKNLHEHLGLPMYFYISNKTVVFDPERDLNEVTRKQYDETGDGPYASPSGQHSQAFLNSSQTSSPDWPDFQIVQFFHQGMKWHIKENDHEDIRPGETPVYCLINLTRPKSIGTVSLNPADIDADPLIDFNFLGDARDEVALVDALRMGFHIFEKTQAYKSIGARFNPSPYKDICGSFSHGSDDYFKCMIKDRGTAALHAAGTCKMGKVDSPDTVVDTELQVVGVKGLRVVDASVMPMVVNGNTQAPIYGIAEKASAMILKKYSN